MIPTFSLCHATARLPNGWRKAYEAWRENCDDWSKVEYILSIDWDEVESVDQSLMDSEVKLIMNLGRKSAVDAWNTTGKAATGRLLITVADDLFPPPRWDTELLKVIPDLDGEYVIEVKSGTSPADDEWMRCMLHSFMTRPYYERIGNFFYPEYVGMWADMDFSEMARRDGVVIDARHLTFQHRHFIGGGAPEDEIYRRQNKQENYDLGNAILGDRRRNNFAGGNRLL